MSYFDAKEFYDLSINIANAYANQAGYRTAIGSDLPQVIVPLSKLELAA